MESDFADGVLPGRLDGDPQRVRAVLIDHFAAWLDALMAGRQALDEAGSALLANLGVTDAGHTVPQEMDLYTLYSSLTSLSQEVKLQGRSFQRLVTELEPLAAKQEDALDTNRRLTRSVDEALATLREESNAPLIREKKRFLAVLVDVRERLSRGQKAGQTSDGSEPEEERYGFWSHFSRRKKETPSAPSPIVEALCKGYALALAEVDDLLGREGVFPVDCSRLFDSATMKAVDVQEQENAPEFTVLEIYRTGYTWNGELLRFAEVKVATRSVSATSPSYKSATTEISNG